MKKLIILITGTIVGLFLLTVVALNLYFTDSRLKELIVPTINEALGTEVQIDKMSLRIFSTFPNVGVGIDGVLLFSPNGDTLQVIRETLVELKLLPLLSKTIEFAKIRIREPQFMYVVFEDGSTNIDFLMSTDSTSATSDSTSMALDINIDAFELSGGNFRYIDKSSNTDIHAQGLDVNASLSYGEHIRSDVNVKMTRLSARIEGDKLISNLGFTLNQSSLFDSTNGLLSIENGSLNVKGLKLLLKGNISGLNDELPTVNLEFESDSKNFGSLLELVPDAYASYVKGVETKGSLTIEGKVNGAVGGDSYPDFSIMMAISDGFFKYPGYKAVDQINLSLKANNEEVTFESIDIKAGENRIMAKGNVSEPLSENPGYDFTANANVNLSTLKEYYDLSEIQISDLKGVLKLDAKTNGKVNNPEKATFRADLTLNDGYLFYDYPGVTTPVEKIEIELRATDKRVDIKSFSAYASANLIKLKGYVTDPLNEKKAQFKFESRFDLDLSTVKEFYPINSDTLEIRGDLKGNITANGRLADLENANGSGNISFKKGFIRHRDLGKPISDLEISAGISKNVVTLRSLSFKTGANSASGSGKITNYLSDNPSLSLALKADVNLGQIKDYYDISEFVTEINGTASTNMTLNGKVNELQKLTFIGAVNVKNTSIIQNDLPKPISNLNVNLNFTQKNVKLENLSLKMGESDIKINGELEEYMIFIDSDRKGTSTLTGAINSTLLNLDELIDFDAEADESEPEPIYIELPNLKSEVNADLKRIVFFDVNMTNLKAKTASSPNQVKLENASVNVFGGSVEGQFTWLIKKRDLTNIDFNGSITQVNAAEFFKGLKLGGKETRFHEYISGNLNANAVYKTDLDAYLTPDLTTNDANGTFSMSKTVLENHPVQLKLAQWLTNDGLKRLIIDDWNAAFEIVKGVLEIKEMKLTSGGIGVELNGTHNLATDQMDMKMSLFLPASFGDKLASIITRDAVNALTQKDGTILVPLKLTGKSTNPSVSPDQAVIKPLVEKYLKDKVGDKAKKLIKGLFDN